MNKTIHYCWFGRNPLPKSAIKCIDSWRKYFPDYEIKEWNEDNYDVYKIPYTKQAYEAKKYAFVSDFARFDILYQYGGIYFDTDVEVIKPFDDILKNGSFMGCEIDGANCLQTEDSEINFDNCILVNPGLGIAAIPGLSIYKEIINYYSTQSFVLQDGSFNMETVVKKTTNILLKNGLKNFKGIQSVCGITFYPQEFFCPYDYRNGVLSLTENTHSIHWNSMTWASKTSIFKSRFTRVFHRLFGNDCFEFVKRGK